MTTEREKYQEPVIEIIFFEAEDVITTSGDLMGQQPFDGGNYTLTF